MTTDNTFPTHRLYGHPVPEPERVQAVTRSIPEFPDQTPRQAVRNYLNMALLGQGRGWVYVSTGKTATSSTLPFLYQMQFGHPLTARFVPENDINPSAIIHALAEHGVFSRALLEGLSSIDIRALDAPRLLSVRNPYDRAVSAFRYLCKSQEAAKPWFLHERLRLDAAVGFDWDSMSGTVEGLRRFLTFLQMEIDAFGVHSLNPHWRPQVACCHPSVFQPDIVGRTEDLPAFFAEVAQRMDRPMPEDVISENVQGNDTSSLSSDPEARRLIETIFASDFETFGY